MQLARSRLKKNIEQQTQASTLNHQPKKPIRNNVLKGVFSDYLKLIPTLTMAMIGYFLVWLLINFVYPAQIQNWLFPNSYLPFHILFGFSNFFLFSFLGRRKLWGFFFSVLIGWLVILKLQNITIDFWGIISAVLLAILASFWWLILQYFNKRK